MCGGNPSHREGSDNPEAEIWCYKGKQVTQKQVAQNNEAWEQPLAHGASSSVDKESQKDTEATWRHYLQVSPHTVHKTEAVFSMIREIYGRKPGDPLKDLNVNLAIWGMFMNTPLRSVVHLGKDYEANLRYVKNRLLKTAGQLFRETEKLVSDQTGQTEITGISVTNFQCLWLMSRSLLHSRAYQYSIAKVHVFSDSVFCLGKIGDDLVDKFFKDLNRIDGQPMEFEWKIFPGLTTMGILNEIQLMMGKLQCEPENFTGSIIFMSMFNDIVWDTKGNDEICEKNQRQKNSMLADSRTVIGLS